MATFSYSRLLEITTIANSVGAVFTNPASQITYIRNIILHNANTATEVVTLWNVPDSGGSAGTAGDTNKFFKKTLAVDETVILEFPAPGIVLENTNDTIQADCDTASKVTIQMYGGKEV